MLFKIILLFAVMISSLMFSCTSSDISDTYQQKSTTSKSSRLSNDMTLLDSGQFWDQVDSVEGPLGTITAGTQVRIQPVNDELIITPGTLGSSPKVIAFNAILFDENNIIQYRPAKIFTLLVENSQDEAHRNMKWGDIQEWPEGVKKTVINIDSPSPDRMSSELKYSGKGNVYFFLRTTTGMNSISNIIKMQIEFTD